jgi:hypothetical protein
VLSQIGGIRVTNCRILVVNLQDRREGGQWRSTRSFLLGMLSSNISFVSSRSGL